MNVETAVLLALFIGITSVLLLWIYCDHKDVLQMRLRWKRSVFICNKCAHLYETLSRQKQHTKICPHCGIDNKSLHF